MRLVERQSEVVISVDRRARRSRGPDEVVKVGAGRRKRAGLVVEHTGLSRAVWRFPDRERVTIERATEAELASIESTWAPRRMPRLAHWNWQQIARGSDECFLVRRDDVPVALWAGSRSDGGAPTYVLDYLEVASEHRGSGIWGVFVLGAICTRAREMGAVRIVLGALSERVAWYRRYGATDGAPGWVCEAGLAPMTLGEQTLVAATERLDGFRED